MIGEEVSGYKEGDDDSGKDCVIPSRDTPVSIVFTGVSKNPGGEVKILQFNPLFS